MSRFAAVSSRPFPNGGFPSFPATKSARPRAKSRQARARAPAKAAEPRAKDRRIRIRIHAPAEPHITSARQRARCDNIPVPLSRFATLDEGRDAAMPLSLPRYFTTSTGIFDACSSLWLTLPRYSLKPLRPRLPTTTKS